MHKEVVETAAFTAAEKSVNPIIRTMYHHVLSQRHFVLDEMEDSYLNMDLVLKAYRGEKELIKESPITYIGYINNMLGRALVSDHWQDIPKLLEELGAIKVKHPMALDKRFELGVHDFVFKAWDRATVWLNLYPSDSSSEQMLEMSNWLKAAPQERKAVYARLETRLEKPRLFDRYQMYFDFQLWASCKKNGLVLQNELKKRN